jgi:hypothetical protein
MRRRPSPPSRLAVNALSPELRRNGIKALSARRFGLWSARLALLRDADAAVELV